MCYNNKKEKWHAHELRTSKLFSTTFLEVSLAMCIKRLKICLFFNIVIWLLGIIPKDINKDVGKIELQEYSLKHSLEKQKLDIMYHSDG